MNTSTHIKKTKELLQKLRAEHLQASDKETKEQLKKRIQAHEELLSTLGAG